MMKHIQSFFFSLLFVLTSVCFSPSVFALNSLDQSSNVFKFQHKLATRGNTNAQFRLACMYETGEGIEKSIEQAKHWYELASKAGMKAASDRYTYLEVKEKGYDQAVHLAWLDSVKSDARAHKGAAMLLLGQLYREGIGVKKDLNKSLQLLSEVSVLGEADVDSEIALIEAELDARIQAKQRAIQKKRSAEQAQLQKVKADKQLAEKEKQAAEAAAKAEKQVAKAEKPAVAGPALTAEKQAAKAEKPAVADPALTAEKQAVNAKKTAKSQVEKKPVMSEKRRRYEEVMRKLQLEQQLLNEQQAWSTGGKSTTADDEI